MSSGQKDAWADQPAGTMRDDLLVSAGTGADVGPVQQEQAAYRPRDI